MHPDAKRLRKCGDKPLLNTIVASPLGQHTDQAQEVRCQSHSAKADSSWLLLPFSVYIPDTTLSKCSRKAS